MALHAKKYFEEAAKRGLHPYQITFSKTTETTVSAFNDQVESQQIGVAQDVGAKGLFQGHIGTFVTDALDQDTGMLLAENVLESAKFGKEEKEENFFKGGVRYRKAKTALKDFVPASLKDLREFALSVSQKAKAKDARVSKVTVQLTCQETEDFKINDLGLKVKEKTNVLVGFIEVVAENEAKEPRSGSWMFYSFHGLPDLAIEADKAIDKAVKAAVDFFGSGPVTSGTYNVLLSPDSVASLLSFYMGQISAKAVQKHLSLMEGKLNTPVASKAVTIKHTPHVMSLTSSSYDSDGVPTQDFPLIKKGVLLNYFYSLETANEENKVSNGCGSGNGNAGPIVLTVSAGRSSKDDLLVRMKNGLYITNISGLNSGIDTQTLNFSLPCQGYVVKDGKVAEATSMIIAAGNLGTLFNSVLACANDTDYADGIFTPSLLFKDVSISGK